MPEEKEAEYKNGSRDQPGDRIGIIDIGDVCSPDGGRKNSRDPNNTENTYPQQKTSAITDGIIGKLFFTDFTLIFEPFDTIPTACDFKEGDGEGAFVIRNVSVE